MFLQGLQSGKLVEYAFRKDLDFVSFKVPNRFTIISIQRRKERGCALAMLKCVNLRIFCRSSTARGALVLQGGTNNSSFKAPLANGIAVAVLMMVSSCKSMAS